MSSCSLAYKYTPYTSLYTSYASRSESCFCPSTSAQCALRYCPVTSCLQIVTCEVWAEPWPFAHIRVLNSNLGHEATDAPVSKSFSNTGYAHDKNVWMNSTISIKLLCTSIEGEPLCAHVSRDYLNRTEGMNWALVGKWVCVSQYTSVMKTKKKTSHQQSHDFTDQTLLLMANPKFQLYLIMLKSLTDECVHTSCVSSSGWELSRWAEHTQLHIIFHGTVQK